MSMLPPDRLLDELQALHARYPTLRLIPPEIGATTLEGPIDVDSDERWVRLTLPPGYPAVPPQVREIAGPRGSVKIERQRMHQFEDGTLCLFPHGTHAETWRHDRLAADALDQFQALVRQERTGATAPPLVRRAPARLIIPPGAAILFKKPRGYGTLVAHQIAPGRGDMFVDAIHEDTLPHVIPNILSDEWRKALPHRGRISWVSAPLPEDWRARLNGTAALDRMLADTVPPAHQRHIHDAPVAVLAREDTGQDIDALVLHRPPEHVGMLMVSEVVFTSVDDLVFHRSAPIVPQWSELSTTRVVLVGLGSLGGTIALSLARAGIGRFTLIDPDILRPENLSRHVGTTRDLGRPKVEVIAEQIRAINPNTRITCHPKWLAWDLSAFGAGAELERQLADEQRTLLVSTCAEPHVDRQVNALAARRKLPALFASALGAAEHGRVFRVVPGESACYECIVTAQDERPDDFPRFALQHPAEQPYVQPGLPGLGVDVAQIAQIAARFALQTIARVFRLDLGLPDEPADHLLWTNRGGWIFDRSLQARAERYPRRATCPVCGESPTRPSSTDVTSALERLIERMKQPDGDPP